MDYDSAGSSDDPLEIEEDASEGDESVMQEYSPKPYSPLDLGTFSILFVMGVVLTPIAYILIQAPSAPPQVSMTNPIYTYNATVGNFIALQPGTAAFNQEAAIMNASMSAGYYQELVDYKLELIVFVCIMFAGFLYSRHYVMTSTKSSWLVYVFVITSGLGWGGATAILSILLFNSGIYMIGGIGGFAGLTGVYYSYWILQNRDFVSF